MQVLVTGGAGYIGSHVCLQLLDAGHQVQVLDNLSSGSKAAVPPGAELVLGDVSDTALLEKLLTGAEAVIHLAALKAAGESMEQPGRYATANIGASLGLCRAMMDAGVNILVFSSSAAVYGAPQYLPVDEEHPKEPLNYYGYTKLVIEQNLDWFDRLAGFRSARLRYFNAAGYNPDGRISGLERNPANLLPVVMEAARGLRPELQIFGDDYNTHDGTGVRDYVHASDLADAHLRALQHLAGGGHSFAVNLGSESGASVRDVCAAVERVSGKPVPARVVDRRPGDPDSLVASSRSAFELLGWEGRLSDVGTLVRSTWEQYRREGVGSD